MDEELTPNDSIGPCYGKRLDSIITEWYLRWIRILLTLTDDNLNEFSESATFVNVCTQLMQYINHSTLILSTQNLCDPTVQEWCWCRERRYEDITPPRCQLKHVSPMTPEIQSWLKKRTDNDEMKLQIQGIHFCSFVPSPFSRFLVFLSLCSFDFISVSLLFYYGSFLSDLFVLFYSLDPFLGSVIILIHMHLFFWFYFLDSFQFLFFWFHFFGSFIIFVSLVSFLYSFLWFHFFGSFIIFVSLVSFLYSFLWFHFFGSHIFWFCFFLVNFFSFVGSICLSFRFFVVFLFMI